MILAGVGDRPAALAQAARLEAALALPGLEQARRAVEAGIDLAQIRGAA